MDWNMLIGMLFFLLVTLALAFAIRKGIIPTDALNGLAEGLDKVHQDLIADGEESLFDRLWGYASQAVLAVEQLCKTGAITKEERKDKSLELVEEYAALDGVVLDNAAMRAANTLVEAQVNGLPAKIEYAVAVADETAPVMEEKDDF